MTNITGHSDVLPVKSSVKFFQRSKQEIQKYFSWQLGCKKQPLAHIQKVPVWFFKTCKKSFISWHCPVKKAEKERKGLSQIRRHQRKLGVSSNFIQLRAQHTVYTMAVNQRVCIRVSPFRLKKFSLTSEIKQIWIRFTCVSLFHCKISLIFFRSFSLRFTWVIFASKRYKAKRNSSLFFSFFSRFFHFFRIFFAFFAFFAFFRFKFFASLRFSYFALKQNKEKRNSSLLFRFFRFFHFFCFIFVSLRFFHLIFAYFTFISPQIFGVSHRSESCEIRLFLLPSETKFSLQFQISLPKRKWGRTLVCISRCEFRNPGLTKHGYKAPLECTNYATESL